jgi:hypothetical protein
MAALTSNKTKSKRSSVVATASTATAANTKHTGDPPSNEVFEIEDFTCATDWERYAQLSERYSLAVVMFVCC